MKKSEEPTAAMDVETRQLLGQWAESRAEGRPDLGVYANGVNDECLHQLFQKQAARTPDALAVSFEDDHISFDELDRRSNRVANYLRTRGVAPDVLVGVFLERSIEMIVSLMGILKAGGAYVPLDPAYPKDRVAFMLRDADTRLVITTRNSPDGLPAPESEWICVDELLGEIDQSSETAPPNLSTPDNLAYVIYTSGSTGMPKGVMGVGQGAINRFKWMWETHQFEQGEICAQKTSLNFLDSLWEIFGPLLQGVSIVIVPDRKVKDPSQLLDAISERGITRIVLVPSLLRAIMDTQGDVAGRLSGLKYCVSSGEAFPLDLVNRFRQLLPQCSLLNLYGSSEVSADVTWVDLGRADCTTGVPIGRPISNTQVYILDGLLRLAPMGEPGHLYIGGVGLARGYLNNTDLTAERFIPCPCGVESGQRLYKTGDLARYRSDGVIEYLGRSDYQVKVRGFRVELGEIEKVLLQHPAVHSAVVTARKTHTGENSLVAYALPASLGRFSHESVNQWRRERISEWRTVWDETYDQTSGQHDPTFNHIGWNSSYTGLPVPPEEVQEWLDLISERILSLAPRDALEIACGSGMILFRIAPHCRRYLATDFSAPILDRLQRQLSAPGSQLPQVTLSRRLADDFDGIEPESFDTVILTGLTQYLPGIEYLANVLENAVKVVKPGGSIFIGDVRSLPLLEAFHTSVQLHQAPSSLSTRQLTQRIRRQTLHEQELVIDPAFFFALQTRLPNISRVGIHLRRGRSLNEFTKFRYDAVLQIKGDDCAPAAPPSLDWAVDELSIERLHDLIRDSSPDSLIVTGVPNARISAEMQVIEALAGENNPQTVGELRESLRDAIAPGIDPEKFWNLAESLSCKAEIGWSRERHCYDVLFMKRKEIERKGTASALSCVSCPAPVDPTWRSYANDPLEGRLLRKLVPELRAYLQEKLPDYMIPANFALLESFPLTPSGKLNRRELPDPETDRPELEASYIAPRTALEVALTGIWMDVLGIERVGLHDSFFELGGHSLLAVTVISKMRAAFDVDVPLQMFFEAPTVAGQVKCLESVSASEQKRSAPPIIHMGRDREIPVSFGQQRLLFFHHLVPGSPLHNVPVASRLAGKLSVSALESSLNKIVSRHEAFRTTFTQVDGHGAQVIFPARRLKLTIEDLRDLEGKAAREAESARLLSDEAQRPFDLDQGMVIRALLIRLEDEESQLLITMHHIVTDGWSIGLLVNELRELYGAALKGEEAVLPDLAIQYADYAIWQREWLRGEVLERQLGYWKKKLKDLSPLDLPTDRPRPTVQSHRGARLEFVIPAKTTESLKALSRREGVTLFMLLLAAFKLLLHRCSGKNDIAVGVPMAGRNREELNNMMGFFINLLALRDNVDMDKNFRGLIMQIRETTLESYANQDAPFEKVVEELKPERDRSRTPLFQVAYSMQSVPRPVIELPGMSSTHLEVNMSSTQFDLVLSINEEQGELVGWLSYNLDLFDQDTIARWLSHWRNLVTEIATDPDRSLDYWPLSGESELIEQHLLTNSNPSDLDKLLDLLEELDEEEAQRRLISS